METEDRRVLARGFGEEKRETGLLHLLYCPHGLPIFSMCQCVRVLVCVYAPHLVYPFTH